MISSANTPDIDIDALAQTGTSNPGLTERYNVDVRDFVILACVCEAGQLDSAELAARIGVSPTTAAYCIESLEKNGLLVSSQSTPTIVAATKDGRALVRKSVQSDERDKEIHHD